MASESLDIDNASVEISVNLRTVMKSSPPVKLRRTFFGKDKIRSPAFTNAISDCIRTSLSPNGIFLDSSGCQRTRRLSKLRKGLIPRSVKLGTMLNNVRNSLKRSVASITSSLRVSINSHNIEPLISCVDELKSKKIDTSFSESSDGELISEPDVEIKSSSDEIQELNGSKVEKENEIYEVEPIFAGHQLVGDSQLLRFAQNILGMQRKFDQNGKGWLGLCVGGQRICDLHKRVQDGFIPLAKKLIVMIGTNDLLKGTTVEDMCRGLQSLLDSLYKSAEKIILLTLPPVPKLAYLSDHWIKLNYYNEFIFSLKDFYKEKLEIIDISTLFYKKEPRACRVSLFELWFDGPTRRSDLIHINESGFKLMRDVILKQIK